METQDQQVKRETLVRVVPLDLLDLLEVLDQLDK